MLQVLAIGTTGITSVYLHETFNLSLNKLIMCLAIEIHSKLTFLLIMNKKTSLT